MQRQMFIVIIETSAKVNKAIHLLTPSLAETSLIWSEALILSRSRVQHLPDFVLRTLKQVPRCVSNLKEVDVLAKLEIVAQYEQGVGGFYLPSRQYLQYILISVIQWMKLSVKAIGYCQQTHRRLMNIISLGHSSKTVCMVVGSLVSRIWVYWHTITHQLSECYNSLFGLHKLVTPIKDFEWLPREVELPETVHVEFPAFQLTRADIAINPVKYVRKATKVKGQNNSPITSVESNKQSKRMSNKSTKRSASDTLSKSKKMKKKSPPSNKRDLLDTCTPAKPSSKKSAKPTPTQIDMGVEIDRNLFQKQGNAMNKKRITEKCI